MDESPNLQSTPSSPSSSSNGENGMQKGWRPKKMASGLGRERWHYMRAMVAAYLATVATYYLVNWQCDISLRSLVGHHIERHAEFMNLQDGNGGEEFRGVFLYGVGTARWTSHMQNPWLGFMRQETTSLSRDRLSKAFQKDFPDLPLAKLLLIYYGEDERSNGLPNSPDGGSANPQADAGQEPDAEASTGMQEDAGTAWKALPVPISVSGPYRFRRYVNGGIQWSTIFLFWMGIFALLPQMLVDGWPNYNFVKSMGDSERTSKILPDGFANPFGEGIGLLPPDGLRIGFAQKGDRAKMEEMMVQYVSELESLRRKRGGKAPLRLVDLLTRCCRARLRAGTAAASNALDEAVHALRESVDSRYGPLRFICTAIPSLGFIGTIVGIGDALGGVWKIFSAGDSPVALQSAAESLTASLSVAFDTTLVALVCVVTLQLAIHVCLRIEEKMIEQAHRLCQERLVNIMD